MGILCEKSMKEAASACENMKMEKVELMRITREELEVEKKRAQCLKERMEQKKGMKQTVQQPPKPAKINSDARVAELEKALSAKNQSLVELQSTVASLRAKEAECAVQKETISQLEKEVESLHASVQKLKGKENEELMRNENRASYAEQSLEAYKKEMEVFLRDKLNLEAEKKAACEKAAQLETRCAVRGGGDGDVKMVEEELGKANKAIKQYEESIEKFHTLDAAKNEGMLEHVKELSELKAALVKEQSERATLKQTMEDEVSRMQSQLDVGPDACGEA